MSGRRAPSQVSRLAVLLILLALAGGAPAARAADRATVLAAASLTDAFPRIDPSARFSFAGSDELARQIRQGAPADVFASASPAYAQALYRDGLVERPRFLAFNRLVLIVPASNPARISSVYDLNRDGVRLVIANRSVPAGAYARTVLQNLGIPGALRNVVSEEADVRGVLGKVALGQADAGLVYVTDARVAGTRVIRVTIPARAQPRVRYEIAVVRTAPHAAAARAFVARATGPAGRRALRAAGFAFPRRHQHR